MAMDWDTPPFRKEPDPEVTYDYENQAWVVDGRYVRCGHQTECNCYGRKHEGETYQLER